MYPIVNLWKIYLNISIFKMALHSQVLEWADNSNNSNVQFNLDDCWYFNGFLIFFLKKSIYLPGLRNIYLP